MRVLVCSPQHSSASPRDTFPVPLQDPTTTKPSQSSYSCSPSTPGLRLSRQEAHSSEHSPRYSTSTWSLHGVRPNFFLESNEGRLWAPCNFGPGPITPPRARVIPKGCARLMHFRGNRCIVTHPHMFSCRRLCVHHQHDSPPRLDLDPHGPFQQPPICGVLVLVRDRYLGQHASAVRRLPARADE